MRIIADLHLHSRFSRACSQDLTLENNALWCEKKGVNVLGTADFTHPVWFAELESKLEEAEQGLYRLKSGAHPNMRYMLTTELAQIYKRGGKVRRVHNIVLAPSFDAVRKINTWLDSKGANRRSDGRPILGFDSEELYKVFKSLDDGIIVIPAHAWTPWFSVFGSKSGFDSLEECFGEMTPYVYAIETGLSSDPLMNRSLSQLDNVMLISNSDAHSPRNFGREANVFDIAPEKFSYNEFIRILRERDRAAFLYTIEFHPEEGKYHTDGCAACGFSCAPEPRCDLVTSDVSRSHRRCPKCGKLLTVGVLSRVQELADRIDSHPECNEGPLAIACDGVTKFRSIVPLQEVIAEAHGVTTTAGKKVQNAYETLTRDVGTEFHILLDAPIDIIASASTPRIAEAIRRMRASELHITPGYDGVYGKVKIFLQNKNP